MAIKRQIAMPIANSFGVGHGPLEKKYLRNLEIILYNKSIKATGNSPVAF
jgi:hypothetical protein